MRRDLRTPATGAAGAAGVPAAYHEARLAYRQGRIADALLALDDLLEAPELLADPARRDAALLRAWCLIERKDPDAARAWLRTAREARLVPSGDVTARVIDLNARLYAEDHEAIAAEAEELLTTCVDPADLDHAELRLILGASLRWQGRLEDALGHVEFACSAFTVLDEPGRCAVAANFLGWTCLSLGRLTEARRWFEKSLGINTRLEAPARMAQNYQNLAIVCYKQGDYALAVELLEKELELVRPHPDMTCRALIALGNVRRLQGEYFAARAVLLDAFALAEQHGYRREQVLALEFLGDVFRDENRPAEARMYYSRGLAVARELAPRGDLVMELLRRRGECLDREGAHREAEAVLHQALELAREVGDGFETAVIHRCLGVNAARLGRWQLAQRELETALEGLQGLDARYEAMVASYELSRLLLRRIDAGQVGGQSGPVLEAAWQHGLRAQQWGQETESPVLVREIAEHLGEIARRRLLGAEHKSWSASFATHRAVTSRVVAVSRAMQQVLRRCDGFARYGTPVLLSGEPGTGKELLAHRIHENSHRGARPLIRVDCAAPGGDGLAREIFGHLVDGQATPGLVSQAEGGTLLLAGIEHLPRDLQARLLRLIQEGIYRPEGTAREQRGDVRLIATSSADLAGLADRNGFRQDLYFRLRLMSVHVPALRERPEDVVPLLDHFLCRLEGSSLPARTLLGVENLGRLAEHGWPGNADELETLAQQAWLLRDLGRPLTLAVEEGSDGRRRLAFAERPPAGRRAGGLTRAALDDLIARTGGNKARVARNLGISRVTLYRWLRQAESGPAS
ncbi:sigma 54-interacting transcriptional regulator [bacterium]|nr:sigma 54-interacting transcriptional regulator [bacterium]